VTAADFQVRVQLQESLHNLMHNASTSCRPALQRRYRRTAIQTNAHIACAHSEICTRDEASRQRVSKPQYCKTLHMVLCELVCLQINFVHEACTLSTQSYSSITEKLCGLCGQLNVTCTKLTCIATRAALQCVATSCRFTTTAQQHRHSWCVHAAESIFIATNCMHNTYRLPA
jgi:hypothetical protein